MGSNYCKMPRVTVAIFAFLLVVVFLQRPSLGDSDSDGGNNEIFVGRTLEGSGGSDAAERINNINIIGNDEKVGVDGIRENRVTVLTVASLTLIMAAATGLGAVPFFFVELEAQWAGICNGIAAGVMLAASFDLVQEGQKYGEGSCVVIGVMAGGIFIFGCQKFLEQYGDVSMLDIKGADARKMVLVVGIMTLHSFGEGSGVGVSFAGDKGLSQGLLVTIAIAVHNIPEGLAVSMVLASRGVPASNAFLWSVITSLPQPLVAVPAFVCAEAFHKFLPFCMGFAAGCMIWMVIAEVLPDGFKEASASQVASAATLSVAFMETLSAVLQSFEQKKSWENTTGLPISLLFGLGPFLGGFVLVSFATAIRMPQSFSTGMASGIAFVLALWRPLQLWWGGKLGFFYTSILLAGGAFLYQIISSFATSRILRSHAGDDIMKSVRSISPTGFKAFLASSAVAIHAFAEGLALGVAAPKAYGMGRHLMLPVSLYGFPRGACVASCIYGATNSWRSALSAATMTGCAGPIAAIAAILSGIDYSGLDKLMVLACGIVLVPFGGPLVKRALKLNGKHASYGVLLGLAFAMVCLTSTKLVCLHTPYCNSAPETVT